MPDLIKVASAAPHKGRTIYFTTMLQLPGLKKMKTREYEGELAKLHDELVKLQQWVVDKGLKVCVVFAGRDAAGKAGVIKAITERVSPKEQTRRLD